MTDHRICARAALKMVNDYIQVRIEKDGKVDSSDVLTYIWELLRTLGDEESEP